MSRVQHRNASLQAIVQLRRLIERRAQSVTMLAEQRVIQAKHQQHAEHERLDETVSQWAALFDGGVLEPELVQSWGGAVIARSSVLMRLAWRSLTNSSSSLPRKRASTELAPKVTVLRPCGAALASAMLHGARNLPWPKLAMPSRGNT